MRLYRSGWMALVLAAACGGGGGGGGDEPDAGTPPPESVRFIAIGDTGEGNDAQYEVAQRMADKCAADGCDFVLLLGDNIYDSGVVGVDDVQWQDKFELPYADLDLPFYAVMGNHDYGGLIGGIGNEFDKGPIAVQYSDVSDKWIMPATHYTFTWGNVGFIMLDTNSVLWDNVDNGDQYEWYASALMEVQGADWIFGAGHHPYLSNGQHGDAGSYDSIDVGGTQIPNPLPIMNGDNVEAFMEDVVCGTVDVYFAGHDHGREWLDTPDACNGTQLIISGAGAKTRAFRGARNPVLWQDATTEGFMYVAIEGDTFTGQFINRAGQLEFERSFTR